MTKEKYLKKIIPVLKDKGLNLPMTTIADAIGITKKTLYNNFSSKDELIDDCVEILSEQFRESVSCLSNPGIPVTDGFRSGIEGLRRFFKECSHAFMCDLAELYPNMASSTHNSGTEFFENQIKMNIERGMDEGIYRPDVDAVLFSKYIAVSIFGFFQREVMRSSSFSADHYFQQVISFNLHALLDNSKQ